MSDFIHSLNGKIPGLFTTSAAIREYVKNINAKKKVRKVKMKPI